MRTKLIACAMALALVTAAGVGTASATAKEVVFEVNGSPLPPGTPLHGETFNGQVLDMYGRYYCNGTFEGEVFENPGGTFAIYEDAFEEEEKPGCYNGGPWLYGGGPLNLTFAEPVTLEPGKEGGVTGSVPGIIEWRAGCEYEATFSLSALAANHTFEIEGIGTGEGGALCGAVEIVFFEAEFGLTSEGEPVTIDVI